MNWHMFWLAIGVFIGLPMLVKTHHILYEYVDERWGDNGVFCIAFGWGLLVATCLGLTL